MAFVVINSVSTSTANLPAIIADVQGLGFDVLRTQPGFKSARFISAEDQTEAMMIIEWESRDHFVAYRQSETGRRMVDGAAALHPKIGFYEVITAVDPPAR